MASIKLNFSFFFFTLLLLLSLLSAASLISLLILRNPPSPFGFSLLAVSAFTLATSLLGIFGELCRCFYTGQVTLFVVSSLGQALAAMALLLREERSLVLVGSRRSKPEALFLLRLAAAALVGMFVVQAAALVLSCGVNRTLEVRDYEDEERGTVGWRRRREMARVQEEPDGGAAAVDDAEEGETREKNGQFSKA